MKKGQICEGVVQKYDFPNKGYVIVDDRKICVKGALLGQQVRFLVKKLKKGAGEGRLLEVVRKSPLEDAKPSCPHFGECGGCTYQTLGYENQLRIKEGQVHKLLDNVILTVDKNVETVDKLSVFCDEKAQNSEDYAENVDNFGVQSYFSWEDCFGWEGIKASPLREGYRNKMEYSFGDEYKDGPLALGMHKKGGFYDIVTVDKCTIVHEDYNKIIRAVASFYREKGIPFYKKMQHVGVLRHLVVRRAMCNGDILVNLVTTTRDDLNEPDTAIDLDKLWEKLNISELKDTLLSLDLEGKIVGILHTCNDSLSDAVVPQKVSTIYGQDYIYEEILGLKFKISAFSFFQTNSKSAEVLYETARSYVLGDADGGKFKDKVIYDLYSGTGTIAQMLAPVAKKVIGVEIIEEAVEAAKENASLNGLDNCDFIAGDVLKVLDSIEEKPDMIVLDPPRDGCNPKALEKIIAYGVPEMVYISCKPTSLARDLVMLQEHGYRVVKSCAVDQFPGTVHVETCVLLSKTSEV